MIRIQNIYYMLAYAFRNLKVSDSFLGEVEEFEEAKELLSELLYQSLKRVVKRGIEQEYRQKQGSQKGIRGKIHVVETLKENARQKQSAVCMYQEQTKNHRRNQIIKTTLQILVSSSIPEERRKKLKKMLRYFKEVEVIPYQNIRWSEQKYEKNSQYTCILTLCYFILEGLIQTDRSGKTKIRKCLDERPMSRLYEKFLLEYYKKEMPRLQVKASQIPWILDEGEPLLLPRMQTDIMISDQTKTLIIDAKYYEKVLYTRKDFGTQTLHSQNLYQIFTYVKNQDKERNGTVTGLLLYAKTEEEGDISYEYKMSGNLILAKTLDLSVPFAQVKQQLNQIVEDIFGKQNFSE